MKSFLWLALTVGGACLLVSCAAPGANGRDARLLSSATPPMLAGSAGETTAGHALFLKNCAHCHGADARGDEGPDLHNLDWTNEQIAARIRMGKKGQMTAFAGKLSPMQIAAVVAYLRTLK